MAHKLKVIETGSLFWPEIPSTEVRARPVYAWLVLTAGGQSILIDSGNPRSLIGKSTAVPWFDAPIAMTPEHDLLSQLELFGKSPADIDLLVSTHFDFDHCGNHDLFAYGTRSVVHADALRFAPTSPRYDNRLWNHHGIDYKPFIGELELEPGLTLIPTPGHAKGHVSVSVETSSGALLLAIDAIPDLTSLGDEPLPNFYVEEPESWHRSRAKLLALANEKNAILLPGHEPVSRIEW